jgi:hypothetical protein
MLGVVAVVGLLSGCSNGDEQPEGLPVIDPTAVGSYRAEADEICAQAQEKMAANLGAFEVHNSTSGNVARGVTKVAKPEEVKAYVAGQLVHLEQQQVALKTLQLPAGQSGENLKKLWAEADKILAEVKKNPTEAAYTNPFQDVAEALRLGGFSKCFQKERPASVEDQ